MNYDVVIPTIGRPCLSVMLKSLFAGRGPLPNRVFLVDDRSSPDSSLSENLPDFVQVLHSGGRGPAAARNLGWRASSAEWIAFLDDDVVVSANWRQQLVEDLANCGRSVGASQGNLTVPLPENRPANDWERNVSGLENAAWATADMAYRRRALIDVSGFDERFPRAYREDADLAIRVQEAGWRLTKGKRSTIHPVRPADKWVSLRLQKGNADDVLMRKLHGPDWRTKGEIPAGRRRQHFITTAAAAGAVVAALSGHRRLGASLGAAWIGLTADFAWRRIAPGPRSRDEVVSMIATSVVIPFAASYHFVKGVVGLRSTVPTMPEAPQQRFVKPKAILFDRDGTLVVDVPYNGDPDKVEPVTGAVEALAKLREANVATAVISNQSGIARGIIRREDVLEVNQRLDQMIGPLGPFLFCPHGPEDSCVCRKPQPGMVVEAARRLGVKPHEVVVIGDIGADVEAAKAAGARAILVPTANTLVAEIEAADEVAVNLVDAVDLALGLKS